MAVTGSRITVDVKNPAHPSSGLAGVAVTVSPAVYLTSTMDGSAVTALTSNGLGQIICWAVPGTYTFTPAEGLAIPPQTVEDTTGTEAQTGTVVGGPPGPTGPQGPPATPITFKGTVATSAALPGSGNTAGDAWIASNTLHVWVFNGSVFVDVGSIVGPQGATGATGPLGFTVSNSAPSSPVNGQIWLDTSVDPSPNPIVPVVAWSGTLTVPANTLVRLPTGGLGIKATDYITRSSFDATERAAWTFQPGGHYELITSSGTWVLPTGITTVRTRGKAAGAGGSSGGTATTSGGVTAQVGGPGGGPGGLFDETWAPTGNLTWTIGAKGTGGAAAAANNHAGVAGTAGGTTTVTDGTTSYSAPGGSAGATPAGNSTTGVNGGIQGSAFAPTVAVTGWLPGLGGPSAGVAIPNGEMCGGSGGWSATATLGGLGGIAAPGPGQGAVVTGTPAGTSTGTAGANAIAPGHGGCGGGAGAPGGASGKGGDGADGIGEMWF